MEGLKTGLPRETSRIAFNRIAGGGLLEQIARHASFGQLRHILVLPVGGEDDDFGIRHLPRDLPGRFQAVEPRHRDVNNGHSGAELPRQLDGLTTGFGFANDFHVRLGHH